MGLRLLLNTEQMGYRNPIGEALKRLLRDQGLDFEKVGPLVHPRPVQPGTLRNRFNDTSMLDMENPVHRRWVEEVITAAGPPLTYDALMRKTAEVRAEGHTPLHLGAAQVAMTALIDPTTGKALREYAAREVWKLLGLPEEELDKMLRKLFENVA